MIKTAIYNARKIADELKKEALQIGIPLSDDTDLLKLAAAKIRKTVDIHNIRGMDFDDLLLGALSYLIVRKPSKTLDSYNRKHMRDTFIPNLVISMKANNVPLEDILNNKDLQKILTTFNFDEDLIKRSYSGEKKPVRVVKLKSTDLAELNKTKDRPSIFKEFKGDTEPEFIKFWTTSVANAALNYLRDSRDATLDTARPIVKKNEEGEHELSTSSIYGSPLTLNRSNFFSDYADKFNTEETVDLIDAKRNKKILYKLLSEIDPRYEVMFDNILDSSDKEKMKKALGIVSSTEYERFKTKFEADLKKIIQKLDLTREEAARTFRAKRIAATAYSIVRRYLDANLL